MEMNLRVFGQKLFNGFSLVRRQIVQNNVDLSRPGCLVYERGQKINQLLTCVPLDGLPSTLPVFTSSAAYSEIVP
jgi:hypothetical protein